jgi:hypothetical protein
MVIGVVVVMVGGDDDSNNCGDDGGYDMHYSIIIRPLTIANSRVTVQC